MSAEEHEGWKGNEGDERKVRSSLSASVANRNVSTRIRRHGLLGRGRSRFTSLTRI